MDKGAHTFNNSFLKCVDENASASPSFYDGLYNMQVMEAAKLSYKENKFCRVESLKP